MLVIAVDEMPYLQYIYIYSLIKRETRIILVPLGRLEPGTARILGSEHDRWRDRAGETSLISVNLSLASSSKRIGD